MGMTISIVHEPEYLHVTARGDFTLADAKRQFVEVLEIVRQHKCDKVVFDGREVVGDPTTMERFFYSEFTANLVRNLVESGELHRPRFAYVLIEPVLDPQRFGETVAVNRGMITKAFDNLEDALVWIKIPAA